MRFLLSFNNLFQDLFLFITLKQLPSYTVSLYLEFSSICFCGFIKCFFCISIEEKCALEETNKNHLNNPITRFINHGQFVVLTSLAPLVKSTHFIFPWPENTSWKSSLETSSSSPENFNRQPVCSSKSIPWRNDNLLPLSTTSPRPSRSPACQHLPYLFPQPVSAVAPCPYEERVQNLNITQ